MLQLSLMWPPTGASSCWFSTQTMGATSAVCWLEGGVEEEQKKKDSITRIFFTLLFFSEVFLTLHSEPDALALGGRHPVAGDAVVGADVDAGGARDGQGVALHRND